MARRECGTGVITYDRKSRKYIARYARKDGGHRVKRCADKATAKAALEEWRSAEQDGQNLSGGAQPMRQFLNLWLAERQPHVRPKTYLFYSRMTQYMLPHIGDIQLDRLQPEHVTRLLSVLRKQNLAPRTVKHARDVLRTALNMACQWRYIRWNVAAVIKVKVNEELHGAKALLPSFIRLLLDALVEYELELLYHVALLGLRKGELLGLRWCDLDLEKCLLHVRQQVTDIAGRSLVAPPKSAASCRTLPLPVALAQRLLERRQLQQQRRQHCGRAWNDHDLVFPSATGTPIQPRNLTRHYNAALKRANVPHARFHDLRHTAATQLAELGCPESLVGAILGHAPGTVTGDYSRHIDVEALRAWVDRLYQLWQPVPKPPQV